MALIQDLMEEAWIERHVKPCVRTHLKRQTVALIIMPKVNQLLNDGGCTEVTFVRELSLEFDGKKSLNDVKQTLSCIESTNQVTVCVSHTHTLFSLFSVTFMVRKLYPRTIRIVLTPCSHWI